MSELDPQVRIGKTPTAYVLEVRPPQDNCEPTNEPEFGIFPARCIDIPPIPSQAYVYHRTNFGMSEATRDPDFTSFAGRVCAKWGIEDAELKLENVDGRRSLFEETLVHETKSV